MSLPEFDVSGQKVLVVGAGRGIGKGIALAFAEAGAKVAIASLTEATVNNVAKEIRDIDGVALPVTGDATTSAGMDKITAEVLAEFGNIDTLVTCVGDSIRKPVAKLPGSDEEGMTEDDWHSVVNINLTEAFQACRAVGPYLLEQGQGSVINISGWASFRGRPGYSAYDASKAGVMRFTETVAQEWAPFGVRVNAVAPGSFPDPEQMSSEDYAERQKSAKGRIPIPRMGNLKEPGYLCVFLASPAASYITGQTWAVDGGISIKAP